MAETVLIIGASRGLGLEFARQYAADGWNVAATTRGNPPTELQGLANKGVYDLDIRSEDAFAALAKELKDNSIAPKVLIHNAGINKGRDGGFGVTTFEVWREVLDVNTVGAVGTARYLMPLLPANAGAIGVFITSELGSIAQAGGGFLPYRASKAALNMMVKTLAFEEKRRGVSVIALHPGWVKTDMGGPNAPLEAPDAIRQMRATIAKVTAEHNGTFLDYKGAKLPW